MKTSIIPGIACITAIAAIIVFGSFLATPPAVSAPKLLPSGVSCGQIAQLEGGQKLSQVLATIGDSPVSKLDDGDDWYSIQVGHGDAFNGAGPGYSGPIVRIQFMKNGPYQDTAISALVYGCPGTHGFFWYP